MWCLDLDRLKFSMDDTNIKSQGVVLCIVINFGCA